MTLFEELIKKGQRGKGAVGQRGKGAGKKGKREEGKKGRRGKGTEGIEEGAKGMTLPLSNYPPPLCPSVPLPLCPFAPLPLCPFLIHSH